MPIRPPGISQLCEIASRLPTVVVVRARLPGTAAPSSRRFPWVALALSCLGSELERIQALAVG